MRQKILLTGATGFIGTHCLKRLFETNLEIYCLCRHSKNPMPRVTWLECDLLNPASLEKIMGDLRPDYLIHTAWYVEHGKFWTSPFNLDHIFATLELWKLFLKYQGIKAIFLGTGAEHRCSHQFEEATLYAKSKFITGKLIAMIHAQNPTSSFVWGRVGGIFGPGENLNRFVPYIINTLLQKKIPAIQNPDTVYAWISVKDLANLLVTMLFEETSSTVDFGIDHRLSLKELSKRVETLLSQESSDNPSAPWRTSSELSPLPLGSFDQELMDYISYLKSFSESTQYACGD